jgi:predicted house-cleaning noncanonical NTP pyrophosphatase (MazG superfamily)
MRVACNKLVRPDPRDHRGSWTPAVTRVLDNADYHAALRTKLLEEAHEGQAAPDGQLASELADALEILQAIAAAHDMSWEDVVSEAGRKRAERGGLENRILLEYVEQAR